MKSSALILLLVLSNLCGFSNPRWKATNTADSIIKKVIERNKVDSYLTLEAEAYLKNSHVLNKAPKRFLGKKVTSLLKLESNKEQILSLYEASSKLYFSKTGEIKEDVKAYKTLGKYRTWEFKHAADLQLNFNKDYITLEVLTPKKFISPIAKNAFKFYKYELEKTEIDKNGVKIDIIKIIPKNRFSPTFNGYIHININTQQICKLFLTLGNNAGISFVNQIKIEQNLLQIDSTYYPTETKITYQGNLAGFYFSGTCVATYRYMHNTVFAKTFAPLEVLKIQAQDSNSNNYVVNKRTVPLSSLEQKASFKHDSLKNSQGEKKYLDSLDRLTLKQRLYPLLFSRFKFQNSYRRYTFYMDAVAPSLFYNTVEGPGIKYGVEFIKYAYNGSSWQIRPEIRYGFKNNELNSDLSFSWLYDPKNRAAVNLSLGSTYRDLNPNGTLSTLNNSLNTLLFEQNFLKLYRKEYVSVSSGREITNGLYFSGGVELSKNISVSNNYDYSLRDIKTRNFTSNNPFDPIIGGKLFPDHTTFRLSGSLIYNFNHQYITKEGIKIYQIPKNPRLILSYRKGIPNILGSETDYDFVELEIQQERLDLGLWGFSSFSFSTGKFLNNRTNYYPDWKHFLGNNALVFNSNLKSFHFLDFYAYSTDKQFIEAHYEHNFNSKFIGRLPLLRKLKLQELAGAAYLGSPDRGSYYEFYIGLSRLTVRADYAISFGENGRLNQGFKLAYSF
ncbi:DUF5686 family protein [Pedobacter glucosidilyticus]|uniref:DUF5686 family protein n=1 Tax=Pedobacter glucosidilyticus TaxID=1122941 RepID=UPI0026EB2984|nr:DUF5686 family protein [Pedobacter glucosidilyticus]